MSRPRIGIDLDGCVYNWGDTVRYMIKKYHNIDLEESTHWNYVEENVPPEVWKWLWSEGVDLGLFRYGSLIKGSVEGLRELSVLGDLEVVTHRPRGALQDTLRFIANLPDVFAGVHFLTSQEPKSVVGCDVYLDDALHVIDEVFNAGKQAVIFDQPWNQQNDWAFRAHGWDKVGNAIFWSLTTGQAPSRRSR